jgi:hypothetical protein
VHLSAKELLTPEMLARLIEKTCNHAEEETLNFAGFLIEVHDKRQLEILQEKARIEVLENNKKLRTQEEQKLLHLIRDYCQNVNLSVAEAMNFILKETSRFLKEYFDHTDIKSRVSLLERGVTRLVEGKENLLDEESIVGNVIVESYLRVVSSSEINEKNIIGTIIHDEASLDGQLLAIGKSMKVNYKMHDSKLLQDCIFSNESPLDIRKEYSFLGSPILIGPDMIGTVCFFVYQADLKILDVEFIEVISIFKF